MVGIRSFPFVMAYIQGRACWWKKSCTSWYGKYPIIYKVLCISGGCLGFRPSTGRAVSFREFQVDSWAQQNSKPSRSTEAFTVQPNPMESAAISKDACFFFFSAFRQTVELGRWENKKTLGWYESPEVYPYLCALLPSAVAVLEWVLGV